MIRGAGALGFPTGAHVGCPPPEGGLGVRNVFYKGFRVD